MNPTVEAILRRRSIREGFRPDPVPRNVLRQIVACGLAAPSSKNARPWRFHVVTDRELLCAVANTVAAGEDIETYVPYDPATCRPLPGLKSTVLESAAVLRNVSSAIFIENAGTFSGGRASLLAATPEARASSLIGYTLEVIGVGAAMQNMWVAAVALGLSGVFMGDVLIAERKIASLLGASCDLVGVLALGYASKQEDPAAHDDGKRFADAVHWVMPR